ncbi:MAG: diaminopimelate decarboxylase [Actinobacteria bacterium]|nr:diaminopimelate decarboxylase [Actinomycetota bacterium]
MLSLVFPLNATRDARGVLVLGGLPVDRLAAEFGTPLYIYDELTLRRQCRDYVRALAAHVENGLVLYAAKAYVDPTLLRLVAQEGLGLDAVSSGELRVAQAAGFPLERAVFHGNNKLESEIAYALRAGVGRIVVDSLDELALVTQVAAKQGLRAPVMLRVTPGVAAHTHEYIRTGAVDSKFGLDLASGAAEEAVRQAIASPHLDVTGLHAHIGSQIFDVEPYEGTVEIMLDFADRMAGRHGLALRDFSPGGGAGVRYQPADDPPESAHVVAAIARAFKRRAHGRTPRLLIEPGRSIVGRAGVALYRVGTIKRIPNVRTYVAVDGGMADNVRPALYGARYSALLASRTDAGPRTTVTVAGRFCESGDVLLRDVELPALQRDDLLAVPTAGAYHLSMASNYNMVGRPAAVMVHDGVARLTRRRETDDDLLRVFA